MALLLVAPVLAWAADPQIAEFSDTPDPVAAGGTYAYNLRIDNNAVDAANNVRLRVSVPSGASFISATPASQNCVATTATQIDCNLGTVGASGADVRNIVITWRATVPGPNVLNATASLTSDNDSNSANNTQSQTTTVISGANLALTKTGTPDPVVGGANITYTLTGSNAGPNASAAITLTDTLSPSVSFVSATGTGWTCAHVSGTVTCNRTGPHAVGAAIPPVTVVVTVNASSGTVTNTATLAPATSGGTADPDTSDNTASVNTSVSPGADVNIASKTVTSGSPAASGADVTFQIAPRNGGPSAASNAVVTDTLPAGWTFVSASGTNWSCSASGQTVTCTRASLPVGATDNITVVATAPTTSSSSNFTNTATISSSTADPISTNNSGSVTVNVRPEGADLSLTKTKTPNPVNVGSNMTSVITVRNNGPRATTGTVRVIERLGSETYVGFSGTNWACTQSGQDIVCDHPNASGLAVNAGLPTLTITTTATATGAMSNTACTGSSVPSGSSASALPPALGDPITSNDCATATSTATAGAPDLTISKTTSTPTGGDKIMSATESSATFRIVVSNVSSNGAGATGVVIADALPSALYNGLGFTAATIGSPVTVTASAGSSATFNCSTANASLRCTQNGGVLLPGETATVDMVINRPLNGVTATNTATVSNTVEGDSNSTNNSAQDTLTVVPVADLQIAKSVLPTSVHAGENATYTLSFSNNGPSTSAGVSVTDTFSLPVGDAGATVISISSTKSGSSCNILAGAQITPAAPSFTCTIGSMARNEAQSITLVVRPNWMTGEPTRSFDNTATIAATTADANSANNSATATLGVLGAELDLQINKVDVPDLVITGAGDPVPFTLGSTFLNYRVRVTNNGPSYGTGVRVTETMTPPSAKRVRFVCDTTVSGGSTCNSPALCTGANTTSDFGIALPPFTCSVPASASSASGEMASGETKDLFLRFEAVDQPAPTGDVFNNVATVSGNEADVLAGNNTENEQTTTRQKIDLRLTKAASVPTVSLRQPFNWVVTVVNNGPGNSLQTDVTDTLPAGTEITGPITWSRTRLAASGTCSASGLTVSCALGQLDSTGVATITIPVRITSFPSGGSLTNNATVDNDPAKTGAIDVPGGNNSGGATITVLQASLSGTVFQDRDRSGSNGGVPQVAASEPRISGVSLRLTGTDAFGNAVDVTTTSDSNGDYSFTGLAPADATGYTVTETQPSSLANGPVAPPTSGGTAPSSGGSYAGGGSSGNSSYSGVALAAGATATNYNFPELPQASLAGFVYIDANNNGVRDAGSDAPIAGATVRLLNAGSGAVVATTTTDASGAYSFTGLDSTIPYTLEEPLPTGVSNGPVNPGLVNGAACASGCTAQPDQPASGTDRIASIDLSSGFDGTLFNFGERQVTQASISGLIYLDADRDNALGGSESTRLPGVTVRLVQGADCASGTVLQTTTSGADGSWRFDNVNVGQSYLVCETQPAGYGNGNANGSAGSNQITISSLPAAGSSNNLFGETLASIAGSVYQDTGAGTPASFDNGVRNTGETGIAGVPVRLTGTDVNGSAVNLTATTDASGNFLFDNLLPPNAAGYTLTEGSIPVAAGTFLDGREAAGTAGGSAAVNDVVSAIALTAGTAATGYTFGELPVAAVSGSVYLDRNRDGAMDATPTDGRLPGVTVRLVQGTDCASGTTLQTTSTDASGNYSFANVAVGGSYLLCETQPAGYGDGGTNPGTNGSGTVTNAIAITSLPATGSAGNLFGERAASIAGSVYADSSPATPANTNNGVRDAGETGIAGVTITLTGRDITGAAVSRTTTTDASGNYRFDDLVQSDAGGYTVSEGAIPAAAGTFNDGRETAGSVGGSTAANDVISAIVLPAGTQSTDHNFGELPMAPISGTVYIDRNRNGAIEASPTDGRIAGVTLAVYQGSSCSGTPVASTTTDASGNYSFSGLSVGLTYTVCESQPAGYADGGVNAGPSGSSGAANAITITGLPATGSAGNHFGEQVGSLAGAVYADSSNATPANTNNGLRDASETGIAGVPVTLTGRDITGATVSRSTTTDASGNYRFDDLLQSDAGGYTVSEGAIPASAGSFNDGRETAGSAGGNTGVNDAISAIVLAAGTQATGYNFGELPVAPITGTVYIDRNRNGTADASPTDGRIPGVTLALYLGTSCSGTPLATTTTDASGNFTFSGASAGLAYTVCETQPAGYGDGSVNPGSNGASGAANAITISNLPASGSAGNLFGERVGSLAGSVYLDANNDGTRQGSDTGIAGVTVTLTGTDAAGNAVNRSTTTDASGNWSFGDLLAAGAGGYTVTEQAAQPAVTVAGTTTTTTLNGRSTAGSVGGTATPVSSVPSAISAIALPAGTDATAYQFGEILPVAVSGTVFLDINNNGQQNLPSDTGIAGVTLQISGTDDTGAAVNRSVTTGADGSYSVADLRPGTYTVTEPTQPTGTSNGITVPGSAGGSATPQAGTPSAISTIALTTPGAASTGNNFGEIPSNSAITGRVWLDADNNGTADGGESGIALVTLTLTGTDSTGQAVTRTATTDALGNYRFDNLTPGTYTVTEPTQPTDTVDGQVRAGSTGGTVTAKGSTPSVISAIPLGVAQVSSANDFGEVLAGRIAGRVWGDSNNNGAIDSVESGLSGVTLVLTGTDDLGRAVNVTVTTGADGSYAFEGLRPGSYTVTEPTQPAGTLNGQTLAGSLGGTATAVGTTPSAISAIVLPPGGASVANNFAEIGQSPDLRVRKTHDEAILTVGKTATWRVSVRNVGDVASNGSYTVTDQLPTGITLSATPTGNGWVCTGAAGASQFSCSSSTVIAVASTSADVITAITTVGAAAAAASPVNNAVMVDGGGELEVRRPTAAERAAMAGNVASLPLCGSVPEFNACRDAAPVQLAASLSGTVWFDIGAAPRALDGGDTRMPGWRVEVVDPASGQIVGSASTGSDGTYKITELTPGIEYAVRFRDPASQVVFGYPVNGETSPGSSGVSCASGVRASAASSCVVASSAPQLSVVLAAGQNLAEQSLPIDPSGVVYDSATRQPVPGSVVSFAPVGSCPGWSPAASIVGATLGGYTIAGDAIAMTVGDTGAYQFLLAPSAPASCTFGLNVTPPSGYTFQSGVIPPSSGPLVPAGGSGSTFAVQPQAAAPTGAVGTATTYYLSLTTGSAGANVVHNHIPLDPALPTGMSLTKTGDKAVAEVGDSVRYSITVQVTSGPKPAQTTVVDRLPAGFTYIRGTASVDGVTIADPQGGLGPTLAFNLGQIGTSGQAVLKYRVRVGVGAQQGDGINRARAHGCSLPAGCVDANFAPVGGAVATNEGRHAVRVSGGVFATEACVLGKVFVDCNGNHVQDREELGLPGVRLIVSDGTTLISDSEGKYSLCGLPPRSHVIKVDPATLPRGSRLTTSSNRNLGDAGSLWLDLKTGELHRADFIEGSCSNTVLEQVKARRAQGEVRAPETEKQGAPALRFDSKAHGLNSFNSPQQGTDGANQLAPKPRTAAPGTVAPLPRTEIESNVPTPQLPMNRPPPDGRNASQSPDSNGQPNGGSNGTR